MKGYNYKMILALVWASLLTQVGGAFLGKRKRGAHTDTTSLLQNPFDIMKRAFVQVRLCTAVLLINVFFFTFTSRSQRTSNLNFN